MTPHFIVNMQARQLRRNASLLRAFRRVAEGRCVMHETNSLQQLADCSDIIARERPDLVLIAGGDGSLTAGLSALSERLGDDGLPAIAPIPAGTAGTVGRNWGIVGRPIARVQRLLSGPPEIALKPTLAIESFNAQEDVTERRLGFIVGTGLIARFFRLYYAAGAPGYSGSAKVAAHIFLSSLVKGAKAREVLTPMPCRLTVDGVEQKAQAWSLICASVVKNLGLHMMLTYRAGEAPSMPHLVASCLPPGQLGPRAPLVLAGRPLGGKGHVDTLVTDSTIRFAKRDAFVLDGDLIEAHGFHVRAGPMIQLAR